jgi:uncharacterized membrane protein YqjE
VFQLPFTYLLQMLPVFLMVLWASTRMVLLLMLCLWQLNPATSSELFSRRTRELCRDFMP